MLCPDSSGQAMALYDLNIFEIADLSTSNPSGFNSATGEQFWLGYDTITINSGARSDVVTVSDNDAFFDDDDLTQQVAYDQTVHGKLAPAGMLLEAEYEVFVRDSTGKVYTLQLVSVAGDAFTIYGFTVVGDMPTFGEPLTVVGRADGLHGFYLYSDSAAAACFTAGTRIATPGGPVAVETLHPGAAVTLAEGGTAPVALVLCQSVTRQPGGTDAPIRLQKDALGPGRPGARLVLSPQHRVLVPELGALVAAKALTDLPRIAPLPDLARLDYVHLVLARHAVILAEGLPCESFWPGPEALKTLGPEDHAAVRRVMGVAPEPARPFLTVQQARRRLARLSPPRVTP